MNLNLFKIALCWYAILILENVRNAQINKMTDKVEVFGSQFLYLQ